MKKVLITLIISCFLIGMSPINVYAGMNGTEVGTTTGKGDINNNGDIDMNGNKGQQSTQDNSSNSGRSGGGNSNDSSSSNEGNPSTDGGSGGGYYGNNNNIYISDESDSWGDGNWITKASVTYNIEGEQNVDNDNLLSTSVSFEKDSSQYQDYRDKSKSTIRYEWKIYTKDRLKDKYVLLETLYTKEKYMTYHVPKPAYYKVVQTPLETPVQVHNERTEVTIYTIQFNLKLKNSGVSQRSVQSKRYVENATTSETTLPEERQDNLAKTWEGWFDTTYNFNPNRVIVEEDINIIPQSNLVK